MGDKWNKNKKQKNKNKHTKVGVGTKMKTKGYSYVAPKPKPICHSGQNLVHTVNGVDIYAGGINRSGGWDEMNPLPDLAMGPSETLKGSSRTVVPKGWSCNDALPSPPFIVSLDFPDFSTPKVSAKFWYALAQDILSNNIKTVSCQCAGGHGRTGVQVAILSYLLSNEEERKQWPDVAALIKWVREVHCEHAVETKSQQTYIATVCALPEGKSVIVDKYGAGHYYQTATADSQEMSLRMRGIVIPVIYQ